MMEREFCNHHLKWHTKGPACSGVVLLNVDTVIFEAGRDYAQAANDATDCEAARMPGAGERRMKAEQHRQRLLEAVRHAYDSPTVYPIA